MPWTDQNGIEYTFDDNKLTADIDFAQYNGPDKIEIPKSINYQNREYVIVSIAHYYNLLRPRFFHFKCISFPADSCVTSIKYIHTDKITLPPLVDEINASTFRVYGTDLQDIEFNCNRKLRYIDFSAILKSNIEKITIPNSVTEIEKSDYTNTWLVKINKIEFEPYSKLQKIGHHCFSYFSIEKISIPPSVKEISDYAFSACNNLNTIEIKINSELKKIGKYAFSGTCIKEIYIPFQVENIDKECFLSASQLISIDVAEDNPHYSIVDDLLLYHNEIVIFAKKTLESITIPSYIKEISNNAFENCQCLKKIEIPDNSNLEIIHPYAFSKSGIQSIKLPSMLRHIRDRAFYECNNLKDVQFHPNSVLLLIDCNAFYSTVIEEINFPLSLMHIGDSAFENCHQLHKVTIPPDSKLISIGCMAFKSTSIINMSIPVSVKQIGSSAFENCEKMQTFSFPNNSVIDIINEKTFYLAKELKTIKIPSKVYKIDKSAFAYCGKLKTIEFDNNSELRLIDDCAFINTAIETLNIPPHVKKIGISSFEKSSIKKITFNPELQAICKNAFNSCNITDVTIPPSVEFIDECAFHCSNLQNVKIDENSKLRSLGDSVFSTSKITEIYIPSNVDDIKKDCLKGIPELNKIIISKENKHYLFINDGLLLYRDNEQNSYYDTLIFILQNLENILIPQYVKKILKNVHDFTSKIKYLEISKGCEINLERDSLNFGIQTIVLPMSLITSFYYINKHQDIKNIGILDDNIIIEKSTFFGMVNLSCISLPNAKTVKIEKCCPKMKIILPINAKLFGEDLENHEIIKLPQKLLDEKKFPTKKDEEDFIYKNLYI